MDQPNDALPPQYAHLPGLVRLKTTSDSKFLISVGNNEIIRKFRLDRDLEPSSFEAASANGTHTDKPVWSIAVTATRVATGSDDGSVVMYSLPTEQMLSIVYRCTMAVRDLAFSPNERWLAVVSDDLSAALVSVNDPAHAMRLKGHKSPVRSVTFSPDSSQVLTVELDGSIRVFNISPEDASPAYTIPSAAFVSRLNASHENIDFSPKVSWHPDGSCFIVPRDDGDLIAYCADANRVNHFQKQIFQFSDTHSKGPRDVVWSPNGAYLASCDDVSVVIWDVRRQSVVNVHRYDGPQSLAWHPEKNCVFVALTDGCIHTFTGAVPEKLYKEQPSHSELVVPAPRTPHQHEMQEGDDTEDDSERNSNPALDTLANEDNELFGDDIRDRRRPFSEDNEDEEDEGGENNDWIENDDGNYFTPKRRREHRPASHGMAPQWNPQALFRPMRHKFVRPGSTPWIDNRCYLTLNFTGYIWLQKQDTHNVVTITFFDTGNHREYHFTDYEGFDLAGLTNEAAFFGKSCWDENIGQESSVLFRRHGSSRDSWRDSFPSHDAVSNIALSASHAVVCTKLGTVKIYTLHGVPIRIFRQAQYPIISCSAFDDYLFIVRSTEIAHPVMGSNGGGLVYSLENIVKNETLQKDDSVEISPNSKLLSVFFSDIGAPCVYDSDGILLTLTNWRKPMQAKWVPILDTRRISGREGRIEQYWPLGVADGKFHCIILRGAKLQDRIVYPAIPLAVTSEFDLRIPLRYEEPENEDVESEADSDKENEDLEDELADLEDNGNDSGKKKTNGKQSKLSTQERERMRYEEEFICQRVMLDTLKDSIALAGSDSAKAIAKQQLEVEKRILRLVSLGCQEANYGRVISLVQLLEQDVTMEAATKIALRHQLTALANRINEIRESRMATID
ncbi:hypothetical protein CANCADRAFT_2863 [Tortispora caseinolytica NRRL Y-17796]|uniref:Uncharacterized protein n=1 Tax=Tortispora caseinolytica NRRL Y-17796 TaxID=767744 RepID=A0A1E4THA9_9ASCO|nr:hypothetical protein CANCADRAFT_2863 [Tortispora caseinolytica NRRL Y-17796]